jgi:hypothetical protein
MHELPKDTLGSLRSYRGSIYSSRRKEEGSTEYDVDLEKGQYETNEDTIDAAANPTESSLIIVCRWLDVLVLELTMPFTTAPDQVESSVESST